MDRFQLIKLRTLIEGQGYFVENVYDNGLLVSRLDGTGGKFFLSLNDTCPQCGEHLLFSEDNPNECKCMNSNCFYQAFDVKRERVSDVEIKTFTFTIKCPENVLMDVASFMEQATRLIKEQYHELELTYEMDKDNKRRR